MKELVRQATQDDLHDILRLYKSGLDELGFTDWQEHLLIKKITESFILAPCFLVVIDDKISGMAGLTIAITSHNGVATLCDYMFYVEKDVRNINILGGLMGEIKRFAIANQLPVKLEFVCNNDEELRKRMLKKYDFVPHSVTGYFDATS